VTRPPVSPGAPPLNEPFVDAARQREAALVGLWAFLATEALLFGAPLFGLAVYRVLYEPQMQEAAGHLLRMVGAANTAVLLTSSLTMALAVHAARAANRRAAMLLLGATAGLGIAFLAVKGWEWHHEYGEGLWPAGGPGFPMESGPAELFFNLYFAVTGLHFVHLSLAVMGAVGAMAAIALGRPRVEHSARLVEGLGLYWHFVDIVWIFVFPVFYLM